MELIMKDIEVTKDYVKISENFQNTDSNLENMSKLSRYIDYSLKRLEEN